MISKERTVRYLVLFGILIATSNVFAQSSSKGFQASANKGWMVNVEEAYELSQKTNRPILANFTGSDWCGWCKRLKKEVFSQPEFVEWASENVILLELDYPRKTQLPDPQVQQNAQLQQAFRVTGFPTIWMFDLKKPDGKQFQIQAYGKTGYAAGGASSYIKNLKSMMELKEKGIN